MARASQVVASEETRQQMLDRVLFVAANYGAVYADRVQQRLEKVIDALADTPHRHMRLRFITPKRFEYRRVLTKDDRFIFTIDDALKSVTVVRLDRQDVNPTSLDTLP